PAGHLLRPAELGFLASLGIVEVTVRRRLRVAVFSTGDELVSLGSRPETGQIFDSNRYSLYGMLTRLGCDVLDMGVVRDEPATLEAALLQAAASADAVVTSGGVSVGEADFMREMMARLGEVLFWKIAVKPGRPMAFGRIGSGDRQAVLFGLPGNPVSVMVTFYQFVREALLKMMGVDPIPALPTLQVPCAGRLKKQPGRTEFQRGELFLEDGTWKVRASGGQGSAMLHAMARANCFIVLEPDRVAVQPGEMVAVQLMDGLV
ncbi:MAG: molybdopterin molybdotransferase MoeA, partial [Rhodocyclaceae bacterium]